MSPSVDLEGRTLSRYPGGWMRPPLRLWRMIRERYDRLIDKGCFDSDDRLELPDGLLVERERPRARVRVADLLP